MRSDTTKDLQQQQLTMTAFAVGGGLVAGYDEDEDNNCHEHKHKRHKTCKRVEFARYEQWFHYGIGVTGQQERRQVSPQPKQETDSKSNHLQISLEDQMKILESKIELMQSMVDNMALALPSRFITVEDATNDTHDSIAVNDEDTTSNNNNDDHGTSIKLSTIIDADKNYDINRSKTMNEHNDTNSNRNLETINSTSSDNVPDNIQTPKTNRPITPNKDLTPNCIENEIVANEIHMTIENINTKGTSNDIQYTGKGISDAWIPLSLQQQRTKALKLDSNKTICKHINLNTQCNNPMTTNNI